MAEESVVIKIEATIDDFKKKLKEAGTNVKTFTKNVKKSFDKDDATKGSAKSLKEQVRWLGENNDGISRITDRIGEIKGKWKEASKVGKVAMGGTIASIVKMASTALLETGKRYYQQMGEFVKVADPVKYERLTAKLHQSLSKLKSAVGNLIAPIFEFITNGLTAIVDGLTGVIEGLSYVAGFLQGMLGIATRTNETLTESADAMQEASETAQEGLAGFDKLNTFGSMDVSGLEESVKMQDVLAQAQADGSAFMGDVGGWLGDIKDKIYGVWRGFTGWAKDSWNSIKSFASGVWNGVVETASKVWSAITEISSTVWTSITGFAQKSWNAISTSAKSAFDSVKQYAVSIGNTIYTAFTKIGGNLKDIFNGVWKAVRSSFDAMFSGIEGIVNALIGTVKSLIDKVMAIPDAIGGVISGGKGFIDKVASSINPANWFASGGVIEPNNPHLVGVGDSNEREVISPVSTIEEAVRNVLQSEGYGRTEIQQSGPINIELKLDSRTVARAVYDPIKQEARRRGKTNVL